MNSQDYRNLQEAYLDVYAPQEEVEQINELSVNKMNAYINKAEKDRGRLNKKWDQGTATSKERKKVFDREEGEARASKKIRQKTGKDSFRLNALDKLKSAITKESYDLYDIILSHLLDEGYADTQEAAEVMMVNMSEEWREEILDEGIGSAIKGLFAKKKEPEAQKPKSRGAELRQKYGTETSPKRQILDRTRERAEKDEKKYGDSTYSKSVATKSRAAHDKYLKAGYSKYRATGGSGGQGGSGEIGSGNKARKRAAALNNSYDLFDYMMEYLIDEGYADTNENALVIMANMSEEWRENILTEVSQKEFHDGMMKAAAKMPSDVRTPSREELFGSKEERSKIKLPKGVVNPTPDTSANIRKSSEYSSPRASRGLPAAGYN